MLAAILVFFKVMIMLIENEAIKELRNSSRIRVNTASWKIDLVTEI